MNRSEARNLLDGLSPRARETWDADLTDFTGIDPLVVGELRDAGLIENVPLWSDRARSVSDALAPRNSIVELHEALSDEGLAEAIDTFEDWCNGEHLERFDFEPDAARAIIREAVGKMRTIYGEALDALTDLPALDQQAAA